MLAALLPFLLQAAQLLLRDSVALPGSAAALRPLRAHERQVGPPARPRALQLLHHLQPHDRLVEGGRTLDAPGGRQRPDLAHPRGGRAHLQRAGVPLPQRHAASGQCLVEARLGGIVRDPREHGLKAACGVGIGRGPAAVAPGSFESHLLNRALRGRPGQRGLPLLQARVRGGGAAEPGERRDGVRPQVGLRGRGGWHAAARPDGGHLHGAVRHRQQAVPVGAVALQLEQLLRRLAQGRHRLDAVRLVDVAVYLEQQLLQLGKPARVLLLLQHGQRAWPGLAGVAGSLQVPKGGEGRGGRHGGLGHQHVVQLEPV
mmetsp:Transcript_10141/g.25806  ORF Transcript_10141/g.25806 Transcript_10141/m.25806 type:complete len:315 (+) Transcript_10141:2873-3817(+)